MSTRDDCDDGCPDCGEYDCVCVDDFADLDDTGQAMRAEHEFYATQEALQTLAAMPGARCGAAWEDLQRAGRRVFGEQTADAVAVLDPDGSQLAAIVGEFCGWMLAELHANASKGPPRSWRGDAVEGPRWALHETVTHLEKLRRAVEAGDRAKIREHAADVGCCALFVADCARVLETPLPRVVEPRGGGVQYGGGSE